MSDFMDQIAVLKAEFLAESEKADGKVDAGLIKCALLVERTAKLKVNNSAASRGPKGGKVLTASIPGDPPNKRTGLLQASINHRLVSEGGQKWSEVGVGADYGADLEYGTSRIKPRPFLYPSLLENQDKIVETMRQAWNEELT